MSTIQCLSPLSRRFVFWRVMFGFWSTAWPRNPKLFNSQKTELYLAQTLKKLWNFWVILSNKDFFGTLFSVRRLASLIIFDIPLCFFLNSTVPTFPFHNYTSHSGFWLLWNSRKYKKLFTLKVASHNNTTIKVIKLLWCIHALIKMKIWRDKQLPKFCTLLFSIKLRHQPDKVL